MALLGVGRGLSGRRLAVAGHHGAHELAIERVLDFEQRRGDPLEHGAIDGLVARDDPTELLRLALNLHARLLEA